MAAEKNFTFKTDKPTGRMAWVNNPTHEIKYNKVIVGSIEHEKPHRISLRVTKTDIAEDGNTNCPWKWIKLKREFESIEATKEYLLTNREKIMAQFPIALQE